MFNLKVMAGRYNLRSVEPNGIGAETAANAAAMAIATEATNTVQVNVGEMVAQLF